MLQVISLFNRICLFRSKPQDLPVSSSLVLYAIVATCIVLSIRNLLLGVAGNAVAIGCAEALLVAVVLRILLTLFSKPERWHQAATALFGCTALIVAISIPFLMFMGGEISQAAGLSSPRMTILLISSVWNFAVVIFILKETLESSASMTFMITLAIELAVGSVLVQLFGNRLL